MGYLIAEYATFEVRAVIRFLQAGGVNQSEIHCLLQGVYGLNVLSRKETNVWCQKFKDGEKNLKDDEEKKRGIPKTSHADDNCSKVEL
ncbi:hypothetical protein AVEN_5632-1 [Araneus ventricosus]|uniref:Mos1 transposase HTH domain-containing protein n=1 Tax=Araneus ventricosus TaxID=182803 RepID=A0A4Y2T0W3_ARAVE|nr:hypothetical protein AVEN_5632-1 [Araneus ventricosus]